MNGQPWPRGPKVAPAFSILELMMVLALLLVAATITQPIYQNIILRAREAALHDTLFTMRCMIDRFTLDYKCPPASLDIKSSGCSSFPLCIAYPVNVT